MKFTKKTRKLTLLYLNLVITIATLVSFTYSTFAWFSTNRKVSIVMQSVQVAIPGFIVNNYTIYGVTAITKDATNTLITFTNEQVTSIPRYDPQNIDYSRLQKVAVVRVQFTNTSATPVGFYAKTTNATFTTGTTGINPYDDSFTSNCFQITKSPGTTLTTGWTTASLSYVNANSQTFVTIATPPTKTTSLLVTTINPGSSELWFVLEYSPTIMNYIENARMTTSREVRYQDDIAYEVA